VRYTRIEIAVKPNLKDPFARHMMWEMSFTLGYRIENLRIVNVYTVYSDLSNKDLEAFASKVLCDPVLCFYSVASPIALKLTPFNWAVEVSFKQGVTDNVGHTAEQVMKMMFPESECSVYKSTQYLINAKLNLSDVEKICSEVLYNQLIQDIDILPYSSFLKKGGMGAKERHFAVDYMPVTRTFDLNVSDEELVTLSQQRVLALTLEEMKYFRSYFEREEVQIARGKVGLDKKPTDVELECFAQTQSEHCKHKIFNALITYREGKKTETIDSLFNTYIKAITELIALEKPWLVSVFNDNAGVIKFNEKHNLVFKVETHNTPSALDPYGGAITGIVGVDRDPAGTGIGSRIIAHTDVLCFGDPGYRGPLPPRMMHPRRIMEGVVKGIEDGGNKCGIPTINGALIFDQSYSGKPLVFCGSLGIVPEQIGGKKTHIKEVEPKDIIVMVGGKIGKDGIHGATFSSEEIKETSPVQAVQIGDPITQKKMLDMLEEAREKLLFRSLTDNGAGGLSSSVGEMATLSGGAYLDLTKAPLKYPGLDPWEILLSEAQERMTLAVPPEKLEEFLELAKKRDVLAVPMGEFTDSGYFHVCYRGETVLYLELSFLHSRIPLELEALWEEQRIEENIPLLPKSLESIIMEMVSDLNSCSREPIIRRYDHEVGGSTIIKPLVGAGETGPSDGGVIAPIPGEYRGFVLGAGINPFYSRIDTYHMACCAVDEAVRNVVSTGADPDYIALLDNFCWPDPVYHAEKTPEGKYKLAQLVRAAKGLYDTALSYRTPFISGKDSMKNDYKISDHKISVLPTILISGVGIVHDIRKCVTPDFKNSGNTIYLLGKTGNHLGESLYLRKYGGSSKNVPEVDPYLNMKVYRAFFRAVQEGVVASCHDLSEGGLAIAGAECCIGGKKGAWIDLEFLKENIELSLEEILFSESTGRLLVSVVRGRENDFLSIMKDLPVQKLGEITEKERFVIKKGAEVFVDLNVNELEKAFRTPLYSILGMKL